MSWFSRRKLKSCWSCEDDEEEEYEGDDKFDMIF
jgi:hypothetical protein